MLIAMGLAVLLASLPLAAAEPPFEMVTRTPAIYVIDYSTEMRATWQESVEGYAQAPPEMLHLSVIMPWNFRHGPIESLRDVRYEETGPPARMPAAEIPQRASEIEGFVRDLHEAGVRWVVPYICLMTMVGDHEKRTGFWDFYDHWDEYRGLGLYEKPASDPFTWNQQRPDGSPKYFYPHDIALFVPNYRYAISPAHPEWRRWISFVVEQIAETGMDGVFVDNCNSCRDFGPYARAGFEAWIRSRYTEAERQDLFGRTPELTEELGTLAAYESYLYWMDVIRQYCAMCRQTGESVRKPFIVFANGGQNREYAIPFAYRDIDYLMFERSRDTVPGCATTHVVGPFERTRYHDNLFAYACTFGVGGRVRANTLIGEGRPRERYGYNRNAVLLVHAEAAAFSGGGMARSPGAMSSPEFNEVQNLYRRHYEQYGDLYEGKHTWPQAAVACFGSEYYYGNKGHIGAAKAAYDALLERHILTDVLRAPGCFLENLRRYKLIVLPDVQHLSGEQMRALVAYSEGPGELLVYGETGKFDDRMRERQDNPLAALCAGSYFDYETLGAKLGKLRAVMPPVIEPDGLDDLRAQGAVKAAAYVQAAEDPRQVILHILNYNVELGRELDDVEKVPTLKVRLPLPDRFAPARVRLIRVEEGREEVLTPRVAARAARFQVPDAGIHTICVIE